MANWVEIFSGAGAALITALFAWYMRHFNKENTNQHQQAMQRREEGHQENMALRIESKRHLEHISERIDEVRNDVKEVRRRQDDHLEWHAENG